MNNALHKIGDFQVNHSIPQRKMQIDPLKYLHFMPPNTLLHSSVQSNTQRLLQAQSEVCFIFFRFLGLLYCLGFFPFIELGAGFLICLYF